MLFFRIYHQNRNLWCTCQQHFQNKINQTKFLWNLKRIVLCHDMNLWRILQNCINPRETKRKNHKILLFASFLNSFLSEDCITQKKCMLKSAIYLSSSLALFRLFLTCCEQVKIYLSCQPFLYYLIRKRGNLSEDKGQTILKSTQMHKCPTDRVSYNQEYVSPHVLCIT